MNSRILTSSIGEIIEYTGTPPKQPLFTNGVPMSNNAMPNSPKTTLPTDSAERKNYPLASGCLNYFPAALAGVAKVSKIGNDKHNPGMPMHHARGKSGDHSDCILRHLVDTEGLLAARRNGDVNNVLAEQILLEASQLAWRTLAYSQELHELLGGAPLAPGAQK